jgi:hypothetical protein
VLRIYRHLGAVQAKPDVMQIATSFPPLETTSAPSNNALIAMWQAVRPFKARGRRSGKRHQRPAFVRTAPTTSPAVADPALPDVQDAGHVGTTTAALTGRPELPLTHALTGAATGGAHRHKGGLPLPHPSAATEAAAASIINAEPDHSPLRGLDISTRHSRAHHRERI